MSAHFFALEATLPHPRIHLVPLGIRRRIGVSLDRDDISRVGLCELHRFDLHRWVTVDQRRNASIANGRENHFPDSSESGDAIEQIGDVPGVDRVDSCGIDEHAEAALPPALESLKGARLARSLCCENANGVERGHSASKSKIQRDIRVRNKHDRRIDRVPPNLSSANFCRPLDQSVDAESSHLIGPRPPT